MDHNTDTILQLMRKIAAGSDIAEEEFLTESWDAQGKLDKMLVQAWQEIQFWVSDADIRTNDPAYGVQRQAKISHLLRQIEHKLQDQKHR